MTTLTAAQQTALSEAFASAGTVTGARGINQNPVLPKPAVVEAQGDVLDPLAADPAGVNVKVAYDSMLTSDIIGLSFNGNETFTPVNGSLFKEVLFAVPASMVAAAVGKTVRVMYAVIRPDSTTVSGILSLVVQRIAPSQLPTPQITEGSAGVLNLTSFAGPAHLVVRKWPLSVTGQRVWLTVSGPGGVPSLQILNGYPITSTEANAGITRDIPRAELEQYANGSTLTVVCKVEFAGVMDEQSAVELPRPSYTISRQNDSLDLLAPAVREAVNNEIVFAQLPDGTATVLVNYIGMEVGHTVRVRWGGRVPYTTAIQTVTAIGTMTFVIPRYEVIDVIGTSVDVNYSVVTTPGTPLLASKIYALRVRPQALNLVEPTINNTHDNVRASYTGSLKSHTIVVRWLGVVERRTAIQRPERDGYWVDFSIPALWVSENRGKTVLINYSVGIGDNPLIFSQLLRLQL